MREEGNSKSKPETRSNATQPQGYNLPDVVLLHNENERIPESKTPDQETRAENLNKVQEQLQRLLSTERSAALGDSRSLRVIVESGDNSIAKQEELRTALDKVKELAELRKDLEKEQREHPGEAGPATERALRSVSQWMNNQAIPAAEKDLAERKLSPAPGGSIPEIKLDGDFSKAAAQLEASTRWLEEASLRVTTADIKKAVQESNGLIPPSWLNHGKLDDATWERNTRTMLGAVGTVIDTISAMERLHMALPQWQGTLPPGTELRRDANGRISSVKLDLPHDLDMSNPENRAKVSALTDWLKNEQPKFSKLLNEYTNFQYSVGDQSLSGVKLWVDQNNKVIGRAADGETAPPGAKPEAVSSNLIRTECGVEERDGKIVVRRTEQFMDVPIYGYQNSWASPIGQPVVSEKGYAPDEMVAVGAGTKMRLVRADELQSHLDSERRWNKIGTIASVGMDVGMTVSGGLGLYALASKGLATVGKAAAFRAGLNFGLGLSGIIENAGAQEIIPGAGALSSFRHAAFMVMATRDLAGIGTGLVKGAARITGLWKGAAETAEAADPIAAFIKESRARQGAHLLGEGAGVSGSVAFTLKEADDAVSNMEDAGRTQARIASARKIMCRQGVVRNRN
jgi:hypothetical protein